LPPLRARTDWWEGPTPRRANIGKNAGKLVRGGNAPWYSRRECKQRASRQRTRRKIGNRGGSPKNPYFILGWGFQKPRWGGIKKSKKQNQDEGEEERDQAKRGVQKNKEDGWAEEKKLAAKKACRRKLETQFVLPSWKKERDGPNKKKTDG